MCFDLRTVSLLNVVLWIDFWTKYLIEVIGGVVELPEADETSVCHLARNTEQTTLDEVQGEKGDDGTGADPPQHVLKWASIHLTVISKFRDIDMIMESIFAILYFPFIRQMVRYEIITNVQSAPTWSKWLAPSSTANRRPPTERQEQLKCYWYIHVILYRFCFWNRPISVSVQ